jgi:hypothetical protein
MKPNQLIQKYLCCIALLCVLNVQAGVYKWLDGEGRVHFSDHPVENAQELRGYATPKIPAPAAQPPGASTNLYAVFELATPTDNQVLRSSEGNVPIGMLLQPGLQKGHEIRLFLDNGPVKSHFTTTQLILAKVPLGSHQLRAEVINADGETQATSQEITFHLRPSEPTPARSTTESPSP